MTARLSVDVGEGVVMDLAALARGREQSGVAWAYGGTDLNANLLIFDADDGVAEHVNDEVDVLFVGVVGIGVVEVNGQRQEIRSGQVLVIPKGARRAIRGVTDHFAYLTCHRRRAGLWPVGLPRQDNPTGADDREPGA